MTYKQAFKKLICCLLHRWVDYVDGHGYYFCYCKNCNEWVWQKKIKNTMADADFKGKYE